MQRTKLIVYPILATILLILVFQFVENKSRNISVEEYFYQNSDEFADIVDVLRQNKVEGFPLYLTSEDDMEMSRNVQSGNTQNLKSTVIQRSFPKWSVAERRKTAAASDQAAVCACAHSRYFAGGSPSGLRV